MNKQRSHGIEHVVTSYANLQKMTYVQQLQDYETAVMKKRLEEMTEDELERMLNDKK